jgi:PilZ domain
VPINLAPLSRYAVRRAGREATGIDLSSVEPTAQSGRERRAPRERAFLTARIAYNNGSLTLPCTVMQISTTGAKISVPAETNLPELFHISIPQKSVDCRARLIWRRGDMAALAFTPVDAPIEAPSADASAGRIKALLAENEKLKARIGKLTAQIARLTND